jgi:putative ABC transport system substrate-binding protein
MRHVTRRQFVEGVAGLGLAVAGLPLLAGCGLRSSSSTQPPTARRLGWLLPYDETWKQPWVAVMERYLGEHGYVEGRNLIVEYREALEDSGRIPELAAELVHLRCDVIIAAAGSVRDAMSATTTIPIVMIYGGDAVRDGFVSNLSRPEGNVTGIAFFGPEWHGKLVELLKAAVPTISRMGYLWPNVGPPAYLEAAQAAGRVLGVEVVDLGARDSADLANAFAFGLQQGIDGLIVAGSPLTINNTPRIIEFANEHRLPTIHDRNVPAGSSQTFLEQGGLMTYDRNREDLHAQLPVFVLKLFQGTKVADLPVWRSQRLDLSINLRAARLLGITIPPSVLVQAAKVIE